MIEDFRLKVFVVMATERSFTRTAAVLGISQPAVSQHMAELEKQLGHKLLTRQSGGVELTPAGEVFLSYAQKILSDYYDMGKMFQSFPPTTVYVSTSEDIFNYTMEVILASFLKVHPQVNFVLALGQTPDLAVTLDLSKEERGTIRLSYHPSARFASTRLWLYLSELLKPTLE